MIRLHLRIFLGICAQVICNRMAKNAFRPVMKRILCGSSTRLRTVACSNLIVTLESTCPATESAALPATCVACPAFSTPSKNLKQCKCTKQILCPIVQPERESGERDVHVCVQGRQRGLRDKQIGQHQTAGIIGGVCLVVVVIIISVFLVYRANFNKKISGREMIEDIADDDVEEPRIKSGKKQEQRRQIFHRPLKTQAGWLTAQ
ncbi:Hypothetical_protein [Hexamita inflata]|nr:Hypothetical protein HINF_LOCUS18023 [Hexamita inflata]CAI9930382.1 Hypothetical protein HINF_LOCUS18027 [Hexamita inflata]